MMNRSHVISGGEGALADTMRRVRGEFLEMPGLQLTAAQAARLLNLDRESCDAVLSALIEAKFLVKTASERFARA